MSFINPHNFCVIGKNINNIYTIFCLRQIAESYIVIIKVLFNYKGFFMFNENDYIFIPSPIYTVLGVEVFNIHVAYVSDLSVNRSADVLYPYCEVTSSVGIEKDELSLIEERCKELESSLISAAKTLVPNRDMDIPADILEKIQKHQNFSV